MTTLHLQQPESSDQENPQTMQKADLPQKSLEIATSSSTADVSPSTTTGANTPVSSSQCVEQTPSLATAESPESTSSSSSQPASTSDSGDNNTPTAVVAATKSTSSQTISYAELAKKMSQNKPMASTHPTQPKQPIVSQSFSDDAPKGGAGSQFSSSNASSFKKDRKPKSRSSGKENRSSRTSSLDRNERHRSSKKQNSKSKRVVSTSAKDRSANDSNPQEIKSAADVTATATPGSESSEKADSEKPVLKVLVPAPLPEVNIWAVRKHNWKPSSGSPSIAPVAAAAEESNSITSAEENASIKSSSKAEESIPSNSATSSPAVTPVASPVFSKSSNANHAEKSFKSNPIPLEDSSAWPTLQNGAESSKSVSSSRASSPSGVSKTASIGADEDLVSKEGGKIEENGSSKSPAKKSKNKWVPLNLSSIAHEASSSKSKRGKSIARGSDYEKYYNGNGNAENQYSRNHGAHSYHSGGSRENHHRRRPRGENRENKDGHRERKEKVENQNSNATENKVSSNSAKSGEEQVDKAEQQTGSGKPRNGTNNNTNERTGGRRGGRSNSSRSFQRRYHNPSSHGSYSAYPNGHTFVHSMPHIVPGPIATMYPTPTSTPPPYFTTMAPIPASTMMDLDLSTLHTLLQHQIEYYFSLDNLCRDIYFRKQMSSKGFVPLAVLAEFNRVKSLTTDINIVRDALIHSTVVEVIGWKCRRRNDWKRWILPTSTPTSPTQLFTPEIKLKNDDEHHDAEHEDILILGADKAGTVPESVKKPNGDASPSISVGQ